MQAGKLIAISDVHVDTWPRQDADCAREKHRAFLEFMRWVREASGASVFVIVGDLLDIPRPDHAPVLPLFQDIARELTAMLKAGLQVHYLSGNHDAGLIGIEVAMSHPALHIGPSAMIASGSQTVWLEHGHLMDAWLWDYVQRKSASVAQVPPEKAMTHFRRCQAGGISTTPASVYVHETLYAALQWQALETGFAPEEKRRGIQVMGQHLLDDFADVADAQSVIPHQTEIMERLAALGLSPDDLLNHGDLSPEALELFAPIGYRYYSALPWRRAARCRLREIRERHGDAVRSLIMGHIHAPDLYQWQEGDSPLTYANCGSWKGSGGSYVVAENGELSAVQRHWADPLP